MLVVKSALNLPASHEKLKSSLLPCEGEETAAVLSIRFSELDLATAPDERRATSMASSRRGRNLAVFVMVW